MLLNVPSNCGLNPMSCCMQSANIYQPLDIQQQLADLNIEDDVAFALMRELQVNHGWGLGAF